MKKSDITPFIKLFSSPNKKYLYSVNKNEIIEISSQIYLFFETKEQIELDELGKKEWNELAAQGLLGGKHLEKIEHPMSGALEYLLEGELNHLILQVTQNCNLACGYCPYANSTNGKIQRKPDNKSMDFDLAKKCIDFFCNHSYRNREVTISFYGGEPFMNFELIKSSIEYAKKIFIGKGLKFNLTTNATMMTEKVMDYIVENKINIMFSIDGPKQIHDNNRKYINGTGSFDIAFNNFQLLRKKYGVDANTHLSINMVIDSKNDINQIIDFYKSDELIGFEQVEGDLIDYIQLENKETVTDEYIETINYQYFLGYLDNLGLVNDLEIPIFIKPYFYMMEKKLLQFDMPCNEVLSIDAPGGPCIPGQRKLFVSVDGIFYPCEKVNETSDVMKIGNIDKGFDIDSANQMLNIAKLTEEKCKKCWAYRYCEICARTSEENGEYSLDKKSKYCERTYQTTIDLVREYILRDECRSLYVREECKI